MRAVALVLSGVAGLIAFGSAPHTVAAPVPKHLMKEPEGERAKLQGKWALESLTLGGKDVLGPVGQNLGIEVEFRGDALVVTANIGGTVQKTTGTVKHDAGAAPNRFTTTKTSTVDNDGKPVNVGAEKDESFGYAFNGDKLVLVAGVDPGGRGAKPPADPLKPGPNDMVMVLVRVK